MGRCVGSAVTCRFWIRVTHQLMLMSAKITPRPLWSRTPWLLGTSIVTAGMMFGYRFRWKLLEPVLLNWARMVASWSWSDLPASPCERIPPGPWIFRGVFGNAPAAVAKGVEP